MSRSLTLAVALSLALAASTQAAQIPNPLRRAKEKATRAITGQPAQGTPTFDAVVLELTPQLVNQVVLGLQARARFKSPDGKTAAEMRRRAQELTDEAANLNRDHGDERNEYSNKLSTAQSCVGEVMSGISRQQADAFQRRVMGMTGANLEGANSANAKFMAEFQKVTMEMSAAGIAQDTARARKAQEAYNKLMGFDPKADSAKANAQCGVPAPPSWMARADMADAQSAKLLNDARELERVSSDTAVRVSGLGAEQFAMGVERVTAFVSAGNGARGLYVFTKKEEDAINARLAVLRPLIG